MQYSMYTAQDLLNMKNGTVIKHHAEGVGILLRDRKRGLTFIRFRKGRSYKNIYVLSSGYPWNTPLARL